MADVSSTSDQSDGGGQIVGRQQIELKRGKPKAPNKKAADLRRKYEEALLAIRPEITNYWINYGFLEGAQWVTWDVNEGRLRDLPQEPDKTRATVNRMAANTRIIIAKAMQREMVFEVPPTSSDDGAIRGSRIGGTIVRALHDHHDWEILREKHLQALWKGGTAAICVDWDPDARDVILPETDEGEPEVHEGDTLETVLSIAEFVVQPGARDPERAHWWFKAQTHPPQQVQAQFKLDWEPEADGFSAQAPYANRYQGVNPADQKTTLVLTYYERPNHLNKQGSIVVVVNDQVVHEAPWPFPVKDTLNLFVARETVVENRWTGTTILTSARPIQTLINATETNINEHMKRAGNARLAVPLSSIDLIEELSDNAGEILTYSDASNQRPDYISPPQMPNWWQQRPEDLKATLDDLMGVHDVSRGDAPTNSPDSGYGISILVEQDTTPVGRMVKEVARTWSAVASFCLKLYEQEATTPRKTSVSSPGQPGIAIEWSGKDLGGQTDAVIPEDTIMPRNRAAVQQQAQALMQMGMIQPGDLATYIAISEMPDGRRALEAGAPEIAWARQENGLFEAGRLSEVQSWEDDETHIREHNRFRNTAAYRNLDPAARQEVDTHIQAHETQAAGKLGARRAGTQIDPALGLAPRADGAPMLEPLPPTEEGEVDPELVALQQTGGLTDDIMSAMATEGPESEA